MQAQKSISQIKLLRRLVNSILCMDSLTLNEIGKFLACEVVGNNNVRVKKLSSLENADIHSLSFFSGGAYSQDLKNTKASVLILKKEDAHLWDGPSIFHPNPYLAVAQLSKLFLPKKIFKYGVDNLAIVSKNSKVSSDCYIGPFSLVNDNTNIEAGVIISNNVSIGCNVSIGKDTFIHPNVTIGDYVKIGRNCEIFSSASIGTDGFGYTEDASGKWVKIPQTGSVVLKDFVDIGSNTVIDRGAIDNTIIHSGVKIDNQVQIGHNCIIGKDTIIAGCVGIAGSAVIGEKCKIGGAAMILGHLSIANNTTISPGTMITKTIKKTGRRYTSIMPFFDHENWLKIAAKLKQLGKKV